MTLALNPRSLLLAALIAMLALSMAIALPKLSDLPNLPRTKHAQNAHSGQAWDVESIIGVMYGGGFGTVNTYACDDGTYLYTCANPDAVGQLLGLVISQTTGKVITGYTARESYWTGKANSCTFMGPGSFAN